MNTKTRMHFPLYRIFTSEVIKTLMYYVAIQFTFPVLDCIPCWGLVNMQALALSESSQEPQGINTAANLFTSGCLGLLVFGENLPMLWWGGMALITVGIALVRREPTNINPDTHSWDTDAQGKVPGKAD